MVGEAYSTFKNDESFKEEAAILSRTIYRLKLKFRNDKGLKAMEKTNRALLQYLRMHVPEMLETFYGMIPHKYGCDTYLPTLNMLHYVLIRIQGLAKLMVRVVECAKTAALFMEGRVSIGHLWKVAFICFSVVSKIFVLSKQLTRFCCKFYSQLYPFTKTLQNVGVQWLPSEYILPSNLELWLDVDWLDKDDNISIPKPKKIKIPTVFDILESDSDVEFCGEYIEIIDDVDFVKEYIELDKEDENAQAKILDDSIDKKEIILRNDTELTTVKIQEDMGEEVKPVEKNIKEKKKRSKRKKSQHLIGEAKIAKLDEHSQVNRSKENMSNEIVKKPKNKLKIKQSLQEVKPTDTHSERKKNKKKKKKSAKIVNLLEEITTLKDLKKFEKQFDKLQQEYPNSFRNIDKLQRNMLHRSIKTYINKATKSCSNPIKVDLYVVKAKNVLRSSLL